MGDLLARLKELGSLPQGLHWFCPLFDDAGHSVDTSTSVNGAPTDLKEAPANDVERRRRLVSECLQIFAYDGEHVVPHQKYLIRHIDSQLARCDICITEYYRSKRQMIDRLRHEYEEEEVEVLVGIFDKQDFARILRGLDRATKILEAAEPQQRGRGLLDDTSQFALFEALNCEAFLQDPALVRDHLQNPMTLVQTNRRFQVTRYVPAATYFLFDPEPTRCTWAMQLWTKIRTPVSKDDFEFAIRDALAKHMRAVTEPIADLTVIQRFWCGAHLIVEKLSQDLVTHSLLALEVDVCRLSLEHLQFATPALRFLLQTIQSLLEIAPQSFWNSMGTIPPTTVIEQIFNNVQYDRYMMEAHRSEDYGTSPLQDMLTWIKPFMASLPPSQKVQACRSLTFQLLDRLQEERFAAHARAVCKKTGFFVLEWTLSSCNKAEDSHSQVGRMIAVECLEVVGNYIQRVMTIIALPEEDPSRKELAIPAFNTLKVALMLECKTLQTDQETLRLKKDLSPGFCSYTPAIWATVLHRLNQGDAGLAEAALAGIRYFTELEELKIDANDDRYKVKCEFNATFAHLTHSVSQVLEWINDFCPSDLDRLFSHPETITALAALLFCPDDRIYSAGVNLIKTISSEVARKEAIGCLLRGFFDTTLNSFSWALQLVTLNKTWASCPRMLKTLEDTLDVLCNSQNGLLRTRTLAGVTEIEAVQRFWKQQWNALNVIYDMTEEWGRQKVSDNATLKEFCRDTMQLSERLFGQYSVFASALTSSIEASNGAGDTAGNCGLLTHPATTMHSMVKWLRLRDPYLASTSASLTQKVLDRLSDAQMKLAEKPVQFLGYVVQGTPKGRTHLTAHEKAEIARALERNIGRPVLSVDIDSERSDSSRAPSLTRDVIASRKRANAIDFEKWGSKARRSADLAADDEDRTPVLDPRVGELKGLQAYRASDLGRGNHETMRASHDALSASRISKQRSQQAVVQAAFKENREKEKQAKKKRDAEALARIKGRSNDTSTTEGVRVKGLGVEGKDHAPTGPSMMISSSESDTEEDEYDELFGPPPKISDAVRDYQLSRLKAKEHHGP
ncbi:MAG: hypothetical protein Q9177_002066, partial [Variospora cf. flavescens]